MLGLIRLTSYKPCSDILKRPFTGAHQSTLLSGSEMTTNLKWLLLLFQHRKGKYLKTRNNEVLELGTPSRMRMMSLKMIQTIKRSSITVRHRHTIIFLFPLCFSFPSMLFASGTIMKPTKTTRTIIKCCICSICA